MTTPITVTIEKWTRPRVTVGDTITRWTLVFVDKGVTHRIATRPTEFEARQFARQHGWIVERVFSEGDQP